MKPDALIDLIRKSTLFDIFIVSFFILPIAAGQWVNVLEKLQWSLGWGLVAMLVVYAACIWIMFWGIGRQAKRELARDQILAYLDDKKYKMISFERIRLNISSQYTDPFLYRVLDEYPNQFRRAKLKGSKPGIAKLVIEEFTHEG